MAYPFIDRNPCIAPAGKDIFDPCNRVKDCLRILHTEDKINALRRHLDIHEPRDYGPERRGREIGGVFGDIEPCIRPPTKTNFQALDDELKDTVYDSYWNAEVGKCRDPTPGLPKGMIPLSVTHGKLIERSIPAGLLINPPKTAGEVIHEDRQCHSMYLYSHQNYWAGERIFRDYKEPFDSKKIYGCVGKYDISGKNAKECLTWFNNDPTTAVSRRQAEVRNRILPALGKALDPTGIRDVIDPDQVFGRITVKEFHSVPELLNECTPSLVRRDIGSFISAANKLRLRINKLVNDGILILEDVYNAIRSADKEQTTCEMDFDKVLAICKRFDVFIDKEKIEPLLVILGILSQSRIVNYRKFVNFLNINSPFPSLKRMHYIEPPEYTSYDTTYQAMQPPPECYCKQTKARPAGLPTLRFDLPFPPKFKSLADVDSLCGETSARCVVSPSLYTQYGVSHRDFFMPRDKKFIHDIFLKIGVTLSDNDFEKCYAEALELDKTGGVCVETFRNILDRKASERYNQPTADD